MRDHGKKINCSIKGEALSCKPKLAHVDINFLIKVKYFIYGA